jgi:hypothetical protein
MENSYSASNGRMCYSSRGIFQLMADGVDLTKSRKGRFSLLAGELHCIVLAYDNVIFSFKKYQQTLT